MEKALTSTMYQLPAASNEDTVGYSFETYDECLHALESIRLAPMPAECSPVYARFGHPAVWEAERTLAKLHNARWCVLFPSGMASIDAALSVTQRYLSAEQLTFFGQMYPGTVGYARCILEEIRSIPVQFYSVISELDLLPSCQQIIFTESLTNPLLHASPIKSLVERPRTFVIVDNTMATALCLNPLSQGAGLVVESATKYISGHNDILAGAIWGNDEDLCLAVRNYQRRTGVVIAPHSARRLVEHHHTFKARVSRQCSNAARLARHLITKGIFTEVFHPRALHEDATFSSPQAPSFCVRLGGANKQSSRERADALVCALKPAIRFSTSLGSTKTSVMNVSTYIQNQDSDDEYIRVNVGTEDPEYLIEIFDRASEIIR